MVCSMAPETTRAGRGLAAHLAANGFTVVDHRITEDGADAVAATLTEMCDGFAGLVVTTGGTGFAPRDQTPEGTRAVIERDAPGLAEAMRLVSPHGRLSRGVAGIRGLSIICNTPGSPKGTIEQIDAVIDVLPHALDGSCTPPRPNTDEPARRRHCALSANARGRGRSAQVASAPCFVLFSPRVLSKGPPSNCSRRPTSMSSVRRRWTTRRR